MRLYHRAFTALEPSFIICISDIKYPDKARVHYFGARHNSFGSSFDWQFDSYEYGIFTKRSVAWKVMRVTVTSKKIFNTSSTLFCSDDYNKENKKWDRSNCRIRVAILMSRYE